MEVIVSRMACTTACVNPPSSASASPITAVKLSAPGSFGFALGFSARTARGFTYDTAAASEAPARLRHPPRANVIIRKPARSHSSTHMAIHMPTMPQPMPMPSTYPPATANIHDEMTFTVTGVFTSPPR